MQFLSAMIHLSVSVELWLMELISWSSYEGVYWHLLHLVRDLDFEDPSACFSSYDLRG